MTYIMFGKDGCGYCTKAEKLFKEKGVVPVLKDVNKDVDLELLLKTAKHCGVVVKTVPQIFVLSDSGGTHHVGGYTELRTLIG